MASQNTKHTTHEVAIAVRASTSSKPRLVEGHAGIIGTLAQRVRLVRREVVRAWVTSSGCAMARRSGSERERRDEDREGREFGKGEHVGWSKRSMKRRVELREL